MEDFDYFILFYVKPKSLKNLLFQGHCRLNLQMQEDMYDLLHFLIFLDYFNHVSNFIQELIFSNPNASETPIGLKQIHAFEHSSPCPANTL